MMFQHCFLAIETKEPVSANSVAPCVTNEILRRFFAEASPSGVVWFGRGVNFYFWPCCVSMMGLAQGMQHALNRQLAAAQQFRRQRPGQGPLPAQRFLVQPGHCCTCRGERPFDPKRNIANQAFIDVYLAVCK